MKPGLGEGKNFRSFHRGLKSSLQNAQDSTGLLASLASLKAVVFSLHALIDSVEVKAPDTFDDTRN
jgi:hypothetical protein